MIQEFTILFAEMGIAAAICLFAGLIFVIIEMFNPGFGFFGIGGAILLLAGMVLRVTHRGSGNPITQFFLMLLIIMVILIVAFLIMVYSAKKGWLSRSAFVEQTSAVPAGITEGTSDYTSLIGKQGEAISMLRPSGIAIIDGVRHDVVALGEFITSGTLIEVIAVEGVRIVVKAI